MSNPRISIGRDGTIIRHNYQNQPPPPPPSSSFYPRSNNRPTYTNYNTGSNKSWGLLIFLSIVLGGFGADRFYAGRTGLGFAKIAAMGCGVGMIWWAIDVFLALTGKQKDNDGNYIKRR
ncbi:MAG: TM2 domain-containing protein [Treponema sp.]|nr:TM2 domain-containing protein [Treponema sp.]